MPGIAEPAKLTSSSQSLIQTSLCHGRDESWSRRRWQERMLLLPDVRLSTRRGHQIRPCCKTHKYACIYRECRDCRTSKEYKNGLNMDILNAVNLRSCGSVSILFRGIQLTAGIFHIRCVSCVKQRGMFVASARHL